MKKIKDLSADDFPGVDIDKFQEWKNAQLKSVKQSSIGTPILIILILQLVILKGFLPSMLFGIGFIALIIYSLPTTIRINRLQKEMGITIKDIRKARKK